MLLIRKIAEFPDEIEGVALSYEPHHLPRYAHELASLFHSFYNSCRVLTDEQDLRRHGCTWLMPLGLRCVMCSCFWG